MGISIIEFSVENFKIFKKRVKFSMLARKSKHTFKCNGENLLKTSVIYGPNATGKSTLLESLALLRNGIIGSVNNSEGTALPYTPFELSSNSSKPLFCEITFSLNKKIFKYNFSILANKIETENLFEILKSGEEKTYLERKEQVIKVFYDLESSKDVAEIKTRKEVLFISAAAQWNNKLAIDIVEGLGKNLNIINGTNSENTYHSYTMNLFKDNDEKRKKILDYLKKLTSV